MPSHLQLMQAVSLPLCPAIAFSVCVSGILSWNGRCSHCVSVSCSLSALFSYCQDLRESLKSQEKGGFRGLVGLVDYRILWEVAGAACILVLCVYSQSVLLGQSAHKRLAFLVKACVQWTQGFVPWPSA